MLGLGRERNNNYGTACTTISFQAFVHIILPIKAEGGRTPLFQSAKAAEGKK